MQRLLDEQLATHDIVLLDTAPLLDSADTEMLIQMPAATILIVQAERDRLERVRAATDAISRISPPVVGAVLLHRSSTYTTLAPAPEPAAARVEGRENVAQLRPANEALASRGT
jgi:Mrp family chromosome partitioning ATPase